MWVFVKLKFFMIAQNASTKFKINFYVLYVVTIILLSSTIFPCNSLGVKIGFPDNVIVLL